VLTKFYCSLKKYLKVLYVSAKYVILINSNTTEIYMSELRTTRQSSWTSCCMKESSVSQLQSQNHTILNHVTYTVSQKKTSPTFLAITRETIDRFLQYLAEMLLRKQAIICYYIFPPHLINASTLPCETENTEIVSFHVNVTC